MVVLLGEVNSQATLITLIRESCQASELSVLAETDLPVVMGKIFVLAAVQIPVRYTCILAWRAIHARRRNLRQGEERVSRERERERQRLPQRRLRQASA